MARRQRFHTPNATYHVMLRGNDKQPIFFSNGDRSRLCLLLQEGIERFDHQILAFCFMSNHIHLAIRVGNVSISRVMQHLAFRYTSYINRRMNRIGHLFQGRFRSILVDDTQYLKELVRYIHLNPIRAGLVNHPEDYSWSSHRAYMTIDEISWLTKDRLLKNFGHERQEALMIYREYILKGIGVESNLDFKIGFREGILGDDAFVEETIANIKAESNRKIEFPDLIKKVCERYQISEHDLCAPGKHSMPSRARALLALIVREMPEFSLEQLAQFLKRDASGLTKLANRLEKRRNGSEAIASEIQEFRRLLVENN